MHLHRLLATQMQLFLSAMLYHSGFLSYILSSYRSLILTPMYVLYDDLTKTLFPTRSYPRSLRKTSMFLYTVPACLLPILQLIFLLHLLLLHYRNAPSRTPLPESISYIPGRHGNPYTAIRCVTPAQGRMRSAGDTRVCMNNPFAPRPFAAAAEATLLPYSLRAHLKTHCPNNLTDSSLYNQYGGFLSMFGESSTVNNSPLVVFNN